MNKINRKIKIALIVSTAVLIITGGAVTYGFQGVLAALGLLFLLTSAGFGIFMVRKTRLYAKALKYAEWVHNMEFTPVSTDDKKWILKHLDEYVTVEEEILTPTEAVITKKDKLEIMSHLDEFIMKTQMEYNTVTPEDKKFIMENVELLFDIDKEEDRQPFTW
jgi:hypothetical protein